jgi:hypothetical protein
MFSRLMIALCLTFSCFAERIAVVSMAIGESYIDLVSEAIQNKRDYCARQGYDFIYLEHSMDKSRPVPWTKILLVENVLLSNKYDWVFWSDADAIFTNFNIRLENFLDNNYDFIVSKDFNNINTGNFFMKRSRNSFRLLRSIYSQKQYINHPWWENEATIFLYATNPKIQSITKIIDQRLINSYSPKVLGSGIEPWHWQPGDFIIHFASARGERIRELIHEYNLQVMK